MWVSLIAAHCLNFVTSPHRMCTGQLFSFYHTDLAFAIIISSIMGLHADHIAVNESLSTLSNCTNLGSFSVCCLKSFLSLSLHAMNNCNWSFFYIINNLQTTVVWGLSLAFAAFKSPKFIMLVRNHWSYVFLALPCYLSLDLLKSFWWLDGLSEVQVTLDKMMESVFTPEFTDSETLFLGLFPQMPSSNAGV